MKKLIVVRHAKSDWSDLSLDDFDRPLNNRGLRDVPFMAKFLKSKSIKVDLLLSSPAKRAYTTAEIFSQYLDYNEEILLDLNIYEASSKTLFDVVSNIDDKYEIVLIFGHNPGLHDFVEDICQLDVFNIPTCAIVEIDFDIKVWEQISKKKSKLISYDYPKKFKKKGYK